MKNGGITRFSGNGRGFPSVPQLSTFNETVHWLNVVVDEVSLSSEGKYNQIETFT